VKRKVLIKLIKIRAFEQGILRVHLIEGKRHTKCFVGKSQTSIGRHKEISDIDLRSIVKDLEPALGAKWLRQ
jgi:hypothetical protein